MKKLTAFFLSIMIILSCAVTAFAAETEKKESGFVTANLETGTGDNDYARIMLEKYPEAAEYIANELMNNYSKYIGGSSIDVKKFNIPSSESSAVYKAVVNEYTELVHVNPTKISWSSSSGIVSSYRPTFLFSTASEAKAAIEAVDEKVEEYTAAVKDNWDDLHKARYLHDMLATQIVYTNTNNDIEHAAYGALVNSKAVCQGYSHAYGLLLKRCGVDSTIVISSQMNHEWNMVKIDGKFYQVDVTWDDPTEDTLGYVEHTYFLLSDSAFSSDGNHYGWSGEDAVDTTYDNAWWQDIDTAIYYDSDNAKEYYIKKGDNNKGYFTARDENSGEENTLYTIDKYWMVKTGEYAGQGYYWTNCYSQLSQYKDYFYFNDIDSVYKMSFSDETPEKLFTVENEYDIYGLNTTFDGILNYTIKGSPSDADVVYTYELKVDINKLIDAELEIDAEDSFFNEFGITTPQSGYNGLNLLGVQKKNDEENNSMRFVSLISSDVLKNVKEYGYVFTRTSKNTDTAKENAGKLTLENGLKCDCTGTVNSMTGDYGSGDFNASSYKYVTAAVNNISEDKAIVARLYVIDNDGITHYGSYIDSENSAWDGCAARLGDLG